MIIYNLIDLDSTLTKFGLIWITGKINKRLNIEARVLTETNVLCLFNFNKTIQ